MDSRDLAMGMVLLFHITFGVLGNFCLLYHYLFLHFTGCKLRNTDLIMKNLIVTNFLVLLSRGVPQTMTALGWKQFPSDFGCKLLFYVHRVGRGVSIGSTCLLGIFQAITISPRNSRWAELKAKTPKYISLSIALCWLLYMLVNIIIPIYVTSNWRNNTIRKTKDFGYCSAKSTDKLMLSISAALLAFPDVLCLGLMLLASSSMVYILYRHRQRIQRTHRTNFSTRSSPESRAMQTILILVSIFVSFYTFSSILQVCLSIFDNTSWLLVNMSALFAVSFSTVSPFVLLGQDSTVSRHSFAWVRNTNTLIL
ncbi:vomeronasal type-1 receptor 4-like [Tamandua tetradactyla]|uniref:vomeronasal type-1 receptor 4-like n=1 Tax=Tamandua tetradactyla TaxID=48850 RepID=UPI0040547B72